MGGIGLSNNRRTRVKGRISSNLRLCKKFNASSTCDEVDVKAWHMVEENHIKAKGIEGHATH